MALVFEQIDSEGIAHLSYLIGDDRAGVAAVIDPRRDVEVYLSIARERGLRITHAIETHIHADFVSGVHELRARTHAEIYGPASEDYTFDLNPLSEGAEIRLGSVRLRAIHTPGHTPEHVSLLVYDEQQGEAPFGVFTGDTLFNLDVGRPDLLGEGTEERLARQLYHSVFQRLLPLGDRIEVYPAHGAGSACGKAIGDRRRSTIGNERLFNPALVERSAAEFVRWLLEDMPEPPRHYVWLKKVNAGGAPVLGGVPILPPLPLEGFRERMRDPDTILLDTRSLLAFGGGHIEGAINIGLGSYFPNWIGWMIDPERSLLLVLESEREVCPVAEHLFRLGYDRVVGYLHRGMTAWQNAALPLERTGEWTVHELNEHREDSGVTVLDVRSDAEWEQGHVPGAKHIYVPHLEEHLDKLDRDQTIATYCGTGYRASIAASLLQRHGFKSIVNVPGSMTAWKAADLPVQR
jgi:hydroxyacylglutathione hydrolase